MTEDFYFAVATFGYKTNMELTISKYYSGVILSVVFNWFVLMWQAFKLAKARKQYQVPYPILYENKHPSIFNCIQRAHQNSLEWNPSFLIFLLISGITSPILSTISGMVYNIGRIYYALGYYQGNPHKGLWGLYGLFILCFLCMHTAYKLIIS